MTVDLSDLRVGDVVTLRNGQTQTVTIIRTLEHYRRSKYGIYFEGGNGMRHYYTSNGHYRAADESQSQDILSFETPASAFATGTYTHDPRDFVMGPPYREPTVLEFVESLPEGTKVTDHKLTWTVARDAGSTSLMAQNNRTHIFYDVLPYVTIPGLIVKKKMMVTKAFSGWVSVYATWASEVYPSEAAAKAVTDSIEGRTPRIACVFVSGTYEVEED